MPLPLSAALVAGTAVLLLPPGLDDTVAPEVVGALSKFRLTVPASELELSVPSLLDSTGAAFVTGTLFAADPLDAARYCETEEAGWSPAGLAAAASGEPVSAAAAPAPASTRRVPNSKLTSCLIALLPLSMLACPYRGTAPYLELVTSVAGRPCRLYSSPSHGYPKAVEFFHGYASRCLYRPQL